MAQDDYFDDKSGKYIDPNRINLTKPLTDDERESSNLLKQMDEYEASSRKANSNLTMSQGMLDDAEVRLATYNLKKDRIAGDKNLNDVQKQTAFSVLNDANRTLNSELELAQKNVDGDREILSDASARLNIILSAYKSHMHDMNNALSSDQLQELSLIPRTKMTEVQRMTLIDAIGVDEYKKLPML